MEKRTVLMLIASGLLIVAILLAGVYKVELAKKNNVITQIPADKSCDLHKSACSLELPDGGIVTLDIQPRPIRLVQNIDINVSIRAIETEAVVVDFIGTTMDMGPNSVKLKRSAVDSFSGKGMLPVCVQSSMEWQAGVYLQTSEGIVMAPFLFTTKNTLMPDMDF